MKTKKTSQACREGMGNPLEWIAFWQFLGFILLLALIWADQVLDLSDVFFGTPKPGNSWLGTSILTAGIIVIGFITVAHTYAQQKRILQGFLRICTYCKKIKLDNQSWEQLEKYIGEHSRAEFSHGICPECFKRVVSELDAQAPPAADNSLPIKP
ncbi:MAG: hypothetical protein EPN23_09390 [Verrucomicrobia bacterium]|nr:MAG: hypothetical protein EPN23_09390 [Verrucomicrobiota bacterium]